MSHLRKQAKSLLIFDLNGVLGHYSNDFHLYGSTGIYQTGTSGKELTSANNIVWQDKGLGHAIFARPYIKKVTLDMLVREKKKYDIGIWSSND